MSDDEIVIEPMPLIDAEQLLERRHAEQQVLVQIDAQVLRRLRDIAATARKHHAVAQQMWHRYQQVEAELVGLMRGSRGIDHICLTCGRLTRSTCCEG